MNALCGEYVFEKMQLLSGRELSPVKQVYTMHGTPAPDGSNVILICHALTGSHHFAGPDIEGLPPAWFEALVGKGRALDTDKFCLICINNLCSPYGSTSPKSIHPETNQEWGMRFPVVAPRDIATAQKILLEALGIPRVAVVIGCSFGGMVALELALTYPDFAERCIVVAAPARLFPQAIAYNEVQRSAIMSDSEWKEGAYYPSLGPVKGLATARKLAMITYKTEQSFADRWMREPAKGNLHEWGGKFQVETYLEYHGNELVRRFDANCYLYLTRAMDLHDISAGREGLVPAFEPYKNKPMLAVSVSSDLLFASWQVVELVKHAKEAGVRVTHEEIESDNGHDAFLIDFDQLDEFLRGFLKQEGLM